MASYECRACCGVSRVGGDEPGARILADRACMHIRDCASADNGKADWIIHEIQGELRERASRVLSDSWGNPPSSNVQSASGRQNSSPNRSDPFRPIAAR